ncbi:hypothetical protein QCD75_20190 [Arthrobacter sp. PsM3]|nr:hypothetical protein [Arthrobacter sp. PsM3]
MEALVRESSAEVPCYAVTPWSGPVALGEWDLGSRPPATVGLAHGTGAGPSVQTWTTTQDPRLLVGPRRMASEGPRAGASDIPAGHDPLPAGPGSAGPGEEVLIPVDGEHVPFALWRSAGRWWAAAHHGGFALIMEGTGVQPETIALHRIADIEPYLHGRRAQLRALRGET